MYGGQPNEEGTVESLRATVAAQEELIRELIANNSTQENRQVLEEGTSLNSDNDVDLEHDGNAIQMQSLLPRTKKAAAEQRWPISTEENDAAMARRMQDLEMQLHESEYVKHVYEDPVWGPLETHDNEPPTPLQVLGFLLCPCLSGRVLEFRGDAHQRRSRWFSWCPSLEKNKAEVLRYLITTWTVKLFFVQVCLTLLPIFMTGFAPWSVNPMIGPWPSALVACGAKVSALIVYKLQVWRLAMPMLLHGGTIHLLLNMIIQLRQGVLLEKLWGSSICISIYITSGVYSAMLSCIFLVNKLSVGSSGAICGLLGLNIVITLSFSFAKYVDWAAHVGGMVGGTWYGLFFFGSPRQRQFAMCGIACCFGAAALWIAFFLKPDHDMTDM